MPYALPQFTLTRFYELCKEAAKFSASLSSCRQLKTWAVIYELADFNVENLGMKAQDYNTPKFWTLGSVSLNDVHLTWPILSSVDFAGQINDAIDPDCQAYTTYDLQLMVTDLIRADQTGLTGLCEGRNLTQIFEDTEYALRFVVGYLKQVRAAVVTPLVGAPVPGYYNTDFLAWQKTQNLITSWSGSDANPDFSSYENWYLDRFRSLNSVLRFQRLKYQTKDNIAGTYVQIKFPMWDVEDPAPLFYADDRVIIF